MFKTEGVIITNAGFAFLNDIVAKSKQPIWTTIKLGNGDINSEAEARALTNLVSEVKNSGISGHETTPEGYLQLKTNYDNNNLIEDIVIKETGVYAKTAENQTEILVAYVNDGIGETLPAYNGKNPIQRVRNIIIGITQQLNSIVQINKDMYVTIYDLERKVDKISIKTEQLTNTDTDIMSSSASRNLFENGVGADVLGYIEDGGTHTAGTVWLSKFNKGEFKCLVENTDDFIDTNKWLPIDDNSNASKLQNLIVSRSFDLTLNKLAANVNTEFDIYEKSYIHETISGYKIISIFIKDNSGVSLEFCNYNYDNNTSYFQGFRIRSTPPPSTVTFSVVTNYIKIL